MSPADPAQQAYHVVAPSLPGFAFSSGPTGQEFALNDMASVNNKLMHDLGYTKYVAQGGDWGSMIVRIMGIDFPESCVAVHVNMVIAGPPSVFRYPLHLAYLLLWASLQSKDSAFRRMMWWQKEESGEFPCDCLIETCGMNWYARLSRDLRNKTTDAVLRASRFTLGNAGLDPRQNPTPRRR